jgi:hypothetical protein
MGVKKGIDRVRRNYRIRVDIASELISLTRLVNFNRAKDVKEISETFLVENALADYIKRMKSAIKAREVQSE